MPTTSAGVSTRVPTSGRRLGRAWRGLVALIGALLVGLVGLVVEPAAAVADVIDRPAGTVTADALPTAQIDGVVWDLAIVGDWVYAGGQFTTARPAGAAAGVDTAPRGNLMSFNLRTGAMTSWAPSANGVVRRFAVSPDKKRLYVAGDFTAVDGQDRNRVAAFDISAGNGLGSLVNGFAPAAGAPVYGLAATNSTVYLAGFFNSMNGVARSNLAAVQASNGATTGWIADASGGLPRSIALSADQRRLFVAGQFSAINGTTALGMGAVDATTGQVQAYAANSVVWNYGPKAGFYSVRTDAANAYFTAWNFGGSGNFEGMAVTDAGTGQVKALEDCHGDTYDAAPMNGVVYTVSHHHHCSNIGAFPDTDPRSRWQRTDAVTTTATGTVRHNDQAGYSDLFGQPAPSMLSWFPDIAVGSYTGQSQGSWTTAADGQYVVEGGEFPAVNNQPQQGLVRFAVPSLAPRKQGMRASAAESAPTLRQTAPDTVTLSWLANYDRDDQRLTYQLYRGSTLIGTTTGISQFWNRPTLTYVDSGILPGTYSYTVVASDPDGNTQTSTTTSITVPPVSSTPIASDGFGRTGAGWGTADVGGSWSGAPAPSFATTGSVGLLTLRAGSQQAAYLGSTSAANVTSTVTFSVDKLVAGDGPGVMLTARRTRNADYRLRAQLRPTGAVDLMVVRGTGRSETVLRTVRVDGLTYTRGSRLTMRMSVFGSPATITGSVWRTGSTEPAQPQISATNGTRFLQGPGSVGVGASLSTAAMNGPVTVTFANFSSTRTV